MFFFFFIFTSELVSVSPPLPQQTLPLQEGWWSAVWRQGVSMMRAFPLMIGLWLQGVQRAREVAPIKHQCFPLGPEKKWVDRYEGWRKEISNGAKRGGKKKRQEISDWLEHAGSTINLVHSWKHVKYEPTGGKLQPGSVFWFRGFYCEIQSIMLDLKKTSINIEWHLVNWDKYVTLNTLNNKKTPGIKHSCSTTQLFFISFSFYYLIIKHKNSKIWRSVA